MCCRITFARASLMDGFATLIPRWRRAGSWVKWSIISRYKSCSGGGACRRLTRARWRRPWSISGFAVWRRSNVNRVPSEERYWAYMERVIIKSIPFLLTAVLLTSCGKTKAGPPVDNAAPVVVTTTVKKDIPVDVSAVGTIEAYSNVQVKSMIAGEITNVGFTEGQDVKKGALLFVID